MPGKPNSEELGGQLTFAESAQSAHKVTWHCLSLFHWPVKLPSILLRPHQCIMINNPTKVHMQWR